MSEVVSVVMPVFNEAAVIEQVITEIDAELSSRLSAVEIVVVDDASTDATPAALDRLAAALPRLRVLRNAANLGHGPSVRRAIDACTGDWIFQVDSDRQFVIADFWKLWARRGQADLVLGHRRVRHDARHRLVLTRAVAATVAALIGHRVSDPNIPFRLYRRALWTDVARRMPPQALAPSIMTTMGAVARGWRVVEVEVAHLPREHGPSTLRAWRLFKFCARGLAEIAWFRLRLTTAGAAPAASPVADPIR